MNFEKILTQDIGDEVRGDLAQYTSSLAIQATLNGRLKIDIRLGDKYKFYDLASLTKIIFATSAMMRLVDKNKISTGDTISKYLAWWPHRQTQIAQVLSHSA